MSKLNTRPHYDNNARVASVAAKHGLNVGVSANGNVQFHKEPAQKLYELVTTALFGKSANAAGTPSDQINKVRSAVEHLVNVGEYDFIANLAIHARTDMHIRTLPLILVVEFAHALAVRKLHDTGSMNPDKYSYANMRRLVCDVIQRADQITDLYAYALQVFGNKNNIPMAIKRGVADAMNKFGEYHFAKYNRDGAVKFKDVLRIVHPTAKDVTQGEIFAKIMGDTLAIPYTWETQLSANGQLPVGQRLSDTQLWTELLMSGKVGYQAILRNLRNIHQANLPNGVMKQYCLDVIADPKRVAESKQLPFQFLQAYGAISSSTTNGKLVLKAISDAIDASTANIPQIGKNIWLILDYSGSMGNENVNDSAMATSLMLAASMLKANAAGAENISITMFGSSAKTIPGNKFNLSGSVLSIAQALAAHRTGSIAGSTNFNAAIAERKSVGFTPDTIIVCTDGEINMFPYSNMSTFDKDAFKVTINMSNANTTPFIKANGWNELSGWSPAIFDWIPAMRDSDSVLGQLATSYTGPRKRQRSIDDEWKSAIVTTYQGSLA